jgi:hypothetical protein
LFFSGARRQHVVLNVHILRVQNNRPTLKAIDVKAHQNYIRLGLSFRALDGLPFFEVAD